MLPGIDVSHYQKTIAWDRVAAAGIKFAFIKATDGMSGVDPNLAINGLRPGTVGIPIGLYHFWRNTPDTVGRESKNFLKQWQSFHPAPKLPPVLDLEVGAMGAEDHQRWALEWLAEVEYITGRKPMVYTSPGFADQNLTDPKWLEYPLWVAHYTPNAAPRTSHWPSWAFWQHSAVGEVDGISTAVDLDWLNGDDLTPWLKVS